MNIFTYRYIIYIHWLLGTLSNIRIFIFSKFNFLIYILFCSNIFNCTFEQINFITFLYQLNGKNILYVLLVLSINLFNLETLSGQLCPGQPLKKKAREKAREKEIGFGTSVVCDIVMILVMVQEGLIWY